MNNDVWQVPSQSRPGIVYNLMRKADGSVVCSCPAFAFHGSCKHTGQPAEDQPETFSDKPKKKIEQKTEHKEGQATRSGQFQDKVISSDEDGVEVVPVKDIPIDPSHMADVQEISRVELAQRAAEAIARATDHYLVWEGPWAVCQSCPWRHSVPLDFRVWDLVDGKPVKRALAKTK